MYWTFDFARWLAAVFKVCCEHWIAGRRFPVYVNRSGWIVEREKRFVECAKYL
jgi:hypothetical protein